ncbi:hypothetical protein PoB_000935900 [Plakobranchus ocellatus]|uniref:Uncharacterized protein n=1 Tax=Plakobranchus ocellatus TaxID=259542 RepID=A0AAV3YLD7_9GAST|nr:hypothetical protein PoB_000935900 [Plakobranchus ocellatus]
MVWFLYIASLQQGDLRLSGSLSGQGAGGGARPRVRRVPTDLRTDSLATVPPTPQKDDENKKYRKLFLCPSESRSLSVSSNYIHSFMIVAKGKKVI